MEGGAQTRASILGLEERRKERTAVAFLCCRLITIGSWLEPTVIESNHCQLLAWTGSDMWLSSHYRLEIQTGSDSCRHCRFGHIPNQFLVFRDKNRQWRINTTGSPNFGSDEVDSELLFCSSEKHDIPIICHLEAYMHASVPPGKHCLMFVQCF